jgi:hypothetical protein
MISTQLKGEEPWLAPTSINGPSQSVIPEAQFLSNVSWLSEAKSNAGTKLHPSAPVPVATGNVKDRAGQHSTASTT